MGKRGEFRECVQLPDEFKGLERTEALNWNTTHQPGGGREINVETALQRRSLQGDYVKQGDSATRGRLQGSGHV